MIIANQLLLGFQIAFKRSIFKNGVVEEYFCASPLSGNCSAAVFLGLAIAQCFYLRGAGKDDPLGFTYVE